MKRLWLSVLALTPLVIAPPLAADDVSNDTGYRASRIEQNRTRAEARRDCVKQRNAMRRAWYDPWGEWQRQAWDHHTDLMRRDFENRVAWDRAVFDDIAKRDEAVFNQVTAWETLPMRAEMAWMDRQADYMMEVADVEQQAVENAMDAQQQWFEATRPRAVWDLPCY